MISKTDVVTCDQFDMLRPITLHKIQTRLTHGACNDIYKLFEMQIKKSFCKAMFTIAQFVSEVDDNIGNNQSFFI